MTTDTNSKRPLFVYFAKDLVTGRIKIGQSRNPSQRRRNLRSLMGGHPIEMLAVAPATRWTEWNLHWLFRDSLSGPGREWFYPTPDLLALIEFVKEFPSTRTNLPYCVLAHVA